MSREEAAELVYNAYNRDGYGRALQFAPDRQRWLRVADAILEAFQ